MHTPIAEVIRHADASDIESLLVLLREPMVAITGCGTPANEDLFAGKDTETVVAESHEGLLGLVQLRRGARAPSADWRDGAVELRHHHVRTRYRGAGVAARLLEHALAAARKRDAAWIWLKVGKDDIDAIRFYRQHGFRIAGASMCAEGAQAGVTWVMHRALADVRHGGQARSQSSMPPSTSTNSGCVAAAASRHCR